MSAFFHEQLYRSPAVMKALQGSAIVVCGAGALGANLIESLARSGCGSLTVIDRDRIEERNLSTQPYHRSDVGAQKAKMLANSVYRAIGTAVKSMAKDLTVENVKSLIGTPKLVIDAFDNSTSRQVVKDYCAQAQIPCLHAGMASDYAEVIWNEVYQVPSDANDDLCDYPLARNLVMLTVAIASEVAINFIATQTKSSYTLTLKDLSIQPYLG